MKLEPRHKMSTTLGKTSEVSCLMEVEINVRSPSLDQFNTNSNRHCFFTVALQH